MEVSQLIESLVEYAQRHLNAGRLDRVWLKNRLLAMFCLDDVQDAAGALSTDCIDTLFEATSRYAETVLDQDGDVFATEVMGLLMLRPSEIERRFVDLELLQGADSALLDFYAQCKASNYVRMSRIKRNRTWSSQDGTMQMTINLSRPEKTNREIAAAAVETKKRAYPACLLCEQNVGYKGSSVYPARANLRTVSVKLGGKDYFLQYSPYLYFNEHCIVIDREHIPMTVDGATCASLLDFTERFPTYFLGSNAALPIIGGSILSHAHFQGGRYEMPLFRAAPVSKYAFYDLPTVTVQPLAWYNTVMRVRGTSKDEVAAACARIVDSWKNYNHADANISCRTGDTPHNAVTPIARRDGDDYVVECVLRNNRTDVDNPDGIFHAQPCRHNVKSEGIGLIEVLGLFVLPARLNDELRELVSFIADPKIAGALNELSHPLHKHCDLARRVSSNARGVSVDEIERALGEEVAQICCEILRDTAVFKPDRVGADACADFLEKTALKQI